VFAFLASGFIFCIVTGMPMAGYTMTETRELVVSEIDLNTFTGQFWFEAWAVGLATVGVVGGFFCIFALLNGQGKGKWATLGLRCLSLLTPVWLWTIIAIFKEKHTAYSPGWRPAWATMGRRYSQESDQ
jgi:hypothetical protein